MIMKYFIGMLNLLYVPIMIFFSNMGAFTLCFLPSFLLRFICFKERERARERT